DNDNPDYVPPAQGAETQTLPAFDSRNASSTVYQYPNNSNNAAILHPWIVYMPIDPGQHRLLLLDTNLIHRRILDTTVFNADANVPQTVYFSDSLGLMRSLITRDEQLLVKDSIRIRLVHLSPDAGNVTLVVNKVSHFFDSTAYGTASSYID